MILLAWIGGALFARAGEDDAPILAPVPVAVAPIPVGPPRTLDLHAGDDMSAAIHGLPAGSTLTVEAGVYRGPVHVDRPLTIRAESGAVIEGAGTGTVLVITADDVTVLGLAVRGGGSDATQGDAGVLVAGQRVRLEGVDVSDALTGIDLRAADDGAVVGCHVTGKSGSALSQRGDGLRLWESDRNRIEGNTLANVRDLVVWYSEYNTIAGNHVTGSRYGSHFMHASHNTVTGNAYTDDIVGVFVMYSNDLQLTDNVVARANGAAGMGFGFKESDAITVTGNRVFGNTTGIYLDHTPHRIGGLASFVDNTLAYNHAGLRIHGSETGAEFRSNRFHENATQVSVDGRADASGTLFEGNNWSDYTGYDLDRDHFGDIPYAPSALSSTLTQRRPAMAFFSNTTAAGLLDLLAMAFPMFAPRPVLVDARPALG